MKISLGMERVKESSLNGCLGVFVSLIIHIIFFVFYKNYHRHCVALIWQNNLLLCRVKPQYKVLGIMNYIFCPSNSKIHDIMKPRYDEKVWPFIISGFHGTNLGFFVFKTISYLSVQKNNNDRLAAVNKSSPAIVFFLPSLSINSIVNSIPEKLQRVKRPASKCQTHQWQEVAWKRFQLYSD